MISRRVILILSAGALLIFVSGLSLTVGTIAICSVGGAAGSNICGQGIFATTLVTALSVLIGGMATFTTWILGLVKTATLRQWGWFTAILFLTPIASLVYSLKMRDQSPHGS